MGEGPPARRVFSCSACDLRLAWLRPVQPAAAAADGTDCAPAIHDIESRVDRRPEAAIDRQPELAGRHQRTGERDRPLAAQRQAVAERAGAPRAARAVGTVMSTNRFPILIPCHRVIAAAGKLGGYSAPQGLDLKARLLAMEAEGTGAG